MEIRANLPTVLSRAEAALRPVHRTVFLNDSLRSDPTSFLEVAAQTPPPSIGFVVYKAELRDREGKLLFACPGLDAASAALPDVAQYRSLREATDASRGLYDAGSLDAAREKIATALAINPHDTAALRIACRPAHQIGSTGARSRSAGPARRDRSRKSPAAGRSWRPSCSVRATRARAEKMLTAARERGLTTAVTAEQLGRIRLECKDYAGAIQLLDESLRLEPKNQALWFVRADAARSLGRLEDCAASLERGLTLGAAPLERRTSLVRLYLDSGRRVDALKHVRVVASDLPTMQQTGRRTRRFSTSWVRSRKHWMSGARCWMSISTTAGRTCAFPNSWLR